jgi:hypothetical protein
LKEQDRYISVGRVDIHGSHHSVHRKVNRVVTDLKLKSPNMKSAEQECF